MTDQTRDLLFREPEFRETNPQMTARLGPKWHDRLSPGDTVHLKETDGPVIGSASVVGVSLSPFDSLPWIRHHHLPRVIGAYHLEQEMKDIYGDEYSRDALCTAILFDPEFNER
jgi:hypothetical protein